MQLCFGKKIKYFQKYYWGGEKAANYRCIIITCLGSIILIIIIGELLCELAEETR